MLKAGRDEENLIRSLALLCFALACFEACPPLDLLSDIGSEVSNILAIEEKRKG